MNVEDAIAFASEEIATSESLIDAKYLVSYVLNKNFTWLTTWQDKNISVDEEIKLKKLVERRKSGEPIAYITGEKDFWTLTLQTNPSTLIPRPETELLVEKALEFLSKKISNKVLDLGTGTGAIALSIASERKSDIIFASDFISEAVELAKINALKNKVQNVTILQSDWFSNIKDSDFDLIISNPPYVEENDIHLNQGDLRFEPNSALTSADNGFADIKTIIHESKYYLVNGGALMMEHGFEQGEKIRSLLNTAGYSKIETIKDISNLDRITIAIYSSSAS